ncbi:MAG: D-alanine--D-alanine ligase [Anaerolineae bacterium]
MRVAVLANLKQNAPTWEGMSADQWDDLDSPKTIQALVSALESGGHQAEFFEAQIRPPFDLIARLEAYQPDICFNIAESHFGDGREAQIPAVLEMLQLPYTGSKVLTLALALDKPMTKRILWYHGLPTPEFQVFDDAEELLDEDLLDEDGELRFPMFVKPSREGTSMGVSAESIVYTTEQLYTQVRRQLKLYRQPILVEHFIKGREMTLGMVGNIKPPAARRVSDHTAPNVLPEGLTYFPVLEVDIGAYDPEEAGLYTNKMKVEMADDFRYYCPAPIDEAFEHELRLLAAAVFRVTGCKDVARVDFRLDEENGNKPYILEVNPLPGLNPGYSDLCIQAKAAGWSYEELVNTILDLAVQRHALAEQFG